ncbi:MAG: phospho-N-acetylmuramoyl-pentapeptide-transferase [Oscillospiraceae bacterium]|jgi:phospho-N-acetylmuramoyl-pentapeptide-transferase|nr:phospho-N-acetylmuramoyl-pentapeptide-transferase [Oscillospiraceae bacterium]
MIEKLLPAFITAFLTSAILGKLVVMWLRRLKAGQSIREDGPAWHRAKAGTPTMGGVIFIAGVVAACLTAGRESIAEGDYAHIIVLCLSLAFGVIGFLDDAEKLKKKRNLGLTAKQKFLLQVAVAAVFVYLLRSLGLIRPNLYIPFWGLEWIMPAWLYFAFLIFVIVATVNAVNLTDGVDGLAAGTSIPVFLFYCATAYVWGREFLSLSIFSAGLLGGLCGFLIYNFNPAKVFMGDTGSLFLGGAVAGTAIALDMPLIIVTVGILYLLEVLSDIIQIGCFKLSHGKRVFKMAPFHHHLEAGGWTGKKWTEKELFALFTGISALFALLSFFGVSDRFAV